MLTRRHFLALFGAAGGAVAIPRLAGSGTASAGSGVPHPGRPGTVSRSVAEPFTVRMPVPPVLAPVACQDGTDLYQIGIRPTTAELVPGVQTSVLGYNGSFIGPTIRATAGRPVAVTFSNEIDSPANVHLHGGHTPASSDGHPMDVIDPGTSRRYDYPNLQRGATLWYHDHSHHTEADHVYRGLHGFYLIDDPAEAALGLPSGPYDVPILLRDVELDASGQLIVVDDPANRTTILANGRAQPYFPVAARRYRFRLLNGANERVFTLSLTGAPMVQIATDGGLLPAPAPRTELVLGSAERADIVVDFAGCPLGSQVTLNDTSGPVLRFDVTRSVPDTSRVPATLRPLPALPPATATRDVVLSFLLTGDWPVGLVNGQPYDPARVDFQIPRGSTEIWRITNADTDFGGFLHTFHMHLTHFRVLDIDGNPPPPDQLGLKDTVLVPPGKTVRVQATFADYLGKYAFHCHFIEHSSLGMMAQMEIVP